MTDVHRVDLESSRKQFWQPLCGEHLPAVCWPPMYVVSATTALGLQRHLPIQSRTSKSEKESDLPRSLSKVVVGLCLTAWPPALPRIHNRSEKNISVVLPLFILEEKAVHSTFEKDSMPMSLN